MRNLLLYHITRQFSSTRLSAALYSFTRSPQPRNNTQVGEVFLSCTQMGKRAITQREVRERDRFMQQEAECCSWMCTNGVKGHTLSMFYTTPSFLLLFLLQHIFQCRKDPISLYIIHQPLPPLISSLSLSLLRGSQWLSSAHVFWFTLRGALSEAQAESRLQGFVCGTINQVSFNKNRKPDERQREETWGVGAYLGRRGGKKRQERGGMKEGRRERREEGVLDPDPGLQ